MEYLSSGKVLIVDLGSSEIREEELDEEIISSRIGGAGVTTHLFESYRSGDPIVVGCGLLTGTLYPASDLSVITALSPLTGRLCHCPVTLKAGIEFKYCGFDYMVITGQSPKPVFLWIHDGVADIPGAEAVWGKDVWQTTDAWRKEMGDELIQTIAIGKAGEAGSSAAQISVNYWGSSDVWGLGSVFGKKRLKGVAMRGMGLLEVADPEGFVDMCGRLLSEVKAGAWQGKAGIVDLFSAMGRDDAAKWIAPLIHRNSSSYNVPYPANSFAYLEEDPSLLKEPQSQEPGVLLTMPRALLAAMELGLSAKDACGIIRSCLRYGIDPEAVFHSSRLSGKKTSEEIESSISTVAREGESSWKAPFSPGCGFGPLFSKGEASEKWWMRRQAAAYVFGLDPLFAVISPELTEESMLEAVKIGAELDVDKKALDALLEGLCA